MGFCVESFYVIIIFNRAIKTKSGRKYLRRLFISILDTLHWTLLGQQACGRGGERKLVESRVKPEPLA